MENDKGSSAIYSAVRYVLLSASGATSGLVIIWLVGMTFNMTLNPAVLAVAALIGAGIGTTVSAILGRSGSSDTQPVLADNYHETVETQDRVAGQRYLRSHR